MKSRNHDLDALVKEMRGRSPLKSSMLLMVILLFMVTAAIWAFRTELDNVTRAPGRIVPSGDIQVIQAAESGVLRALYVTEGQVVEAGDVLMELDGELLTSQLDQEQQRVFGLQARIKRLQAEIDGSELVFDDDLLAHAADVVQSESALFVGRQDQLKDQIAIFDRRRDQRSQEYQEGLVDLDTAETTLKIVNEERDMLAPLVTRGIEPETTLMAIRRDEAQWIGRTVRARASLRRLQSGLDEIEDQIAAERTSFRAEALADLALATRELAALKPALPALQSRTERASLRAPVRGIVNRIHRSTVGGTAQRGEELIEIVPLDDTLMVEAYVRPVDIAFLRPGQPVKVMITAYDFSRYGGLDGEITRIGADAVTRSAQDAEPVFVVGVRTTGAMLDADGVQVEIIPGMVAEVDILSGRKTVMEYLTGPIVRIKDRAFRE